jgi:hypothetical protein
MKILLIDVAVLKLQQLSRNDHSGTEQGFVANIAL